MLRADFLRTLAFALTPAPTPAATRPNVLFIAVDDLRPELGIYGAGHVASPHIDQLGRQGTVFTHAYCQQALCNPSRASMLTGLRPDTLKVWNLQTGFRTTRPGAVTLPQHCQQQGYHSAGIGKIFHNNLPDPASWSEPELHLRGYPFDPDAVYRSENEVAALEEGKRQITAEGKRNAYLDKLGEWYLKNNSIEAPDVPDDAYYDGAQTTAAIAKLRTLQAAGQPFFLGIGYYRPHLPFNVPKKYWDLYDRATLPLAPNAYLPHDAPPMAHNMNRELRGYRDFAAQPRPDQGTLSEDRARLLRHGYFASVSYVDAQIGRLLSALEQSGLARNTIVVLWGDHGWKLGEHNAWGKMTNYEVDTRVPLIIRAPGLRPGVCAGLVESVDIYPTVCALAGLPTPPGLEGASLVPLMRDPRRPGKSAIFTQYLRDGIWAAPDGVDYMGRSIRTERHRYVEWRKWPSGDWAAHELYDLQKDPGENRNLANSPAAASLRQQLAVRLHRGWQAEPRRRFDAAQGR